MELLVLSSLANWQQQADPHEQLLFFPRAQAMRRGGGSFRRQGSGDGRGGSGRRFSTTDDGGNGSGGDARGGAAAAQSRPGLNNGGGSGRRGGRRPQAPDLGDQEIRGMIQSSSVQYTVCLQLDVEKIAPLETHVRGFEACFGVPGDDAQRSAARSTTVPLAVFGLNDWEEKVEFERVMASLRRPTRFNQANNEGEEEATLECRTRVNCDKKLMEWKYELAFLPTADDTLWLFTNELLLQLRSVGIYGRPLLPMRGSRPIVLASAFAMASPLQDGTQRLEWTGEMAWSQVVVVETPAGSSSEIVQSAHLPTVPSSSTNSSESAAVNLRYPALAPLVEDLLSHNATTKRPAVVILRGIPGSGKSTFGREIAAICKLRETAARCEIISADRFFVGPRGYVFDVKSIGKAHDGCKHQFEGALRKNVANIVVVDNTHTQLWEYGHYVDRARLSGCHVEVLEMCCADLTTCIRMAQRNSHGVPVPKVIQMHLRWEADASALAFTPQFEYAMVNKNPISRSIASSVVYVGLFIGPEERAKLLGLFPPIHSNVFGEHVTIFYRPTKSYVRNVEIGEQVTVCATELVQDAYGQTLRVEFVDELSLKLRNKIAHITISTKSDVGAYYSNELLEDPRANRIALSGDQRITIKAQLGVAVLTQNQRVVTLTSPFGTPESNKSTVLNVERSGGVISKIVVVCIDVKSLVQAMAAVEAAEKNVLSRLALYEQIMHHMGSSESTRRILCVKQNGSLSSASNLRSLEDILLLSPSHRLAFDKFVELSPEMKLIELLRQEEYGNAATSIKKITVLTTLNEHLSLSFEADACFQATTVSVSKLSLPSAHEEPRISSLPAPYALSMTGAMDCLNLGVQERTRHNIRTGVQLARDACQRALGSDLSNALVVERFDSSLVGLDADIIELCASVDDNVELDQVELQRRVVEALADSGVTHTLSGRELDHILFTMCSDVGLSPVFRLQILFAESSAKKNGSSTFKRLDFCHKQRQQVQQLRETETYAALVALLRALFRSHCFEIAGDMLKAPALDVVSEHIVLEFLAQSSEFKKSDVKSNESGELTEEPQTMRLLQLLLEYLESWLNEKWTQALAVVQDLFGGRAEVQQSELVQAVKTCLETMKRFDLETRGAIYRTTLSDKRSTELLQMLLALMQREAKSQESQDTLVRGCIHVNNLSNPLESVALCDTMQQAMWKEHVNPLDNVFACSPSRLLRAKRIEVVAASRELLEQIVADVQSTILDNELGHLQLSLIVE